jgi:glucose-fructose oxidoreductase
MGENNDVSRRGAIGLGLAGVMAAPALAGEAAAQADKPVGFAIVGLGKLSQGQLLPGLTKTKTAKLAGLVSGDPAKAARLADQYKLPASGIYNYQNFDRIIADPNIEVVYIVLPNNMHAEYTIRALKAGKHVLCEKPMATTIADAEAMIAAAKKADRKLMIAYRCHYEPNNLAAMRRIRSGGIGKVRTVITDMSRQSQLEDPSDAWRLDMKMSGGGALADMGVYGVNASRYLLNEEPIEVRAWASTDRSDPRFKTVEDLIAWEFRFPSGAICLGSTSFASNGGMGYQVAGDKGRLVADPACFYNGNRLTFGAPSGKTVEVKEIDQFAREMDWMADVVRGRAPMVAPGEEGLQDMRLMAAILESVKRGGATIKTDFGYRRAVDPATVVDLPA